MRQTHEAPRDRPSPDPAQPSGAYNADQRSHGSPTVNLTDYPATGHFGEATFENWESEFLQMAFYVLLTVRRGGFVLTLYEDSLSIAFAILFVLSFALHVVTGAREFNEERLALGEPPASTRDYAMSSQFWFESYQNWRASFCRSPPWSPSPSPCVSAAHRSRNRSTRPTGIQAAEHPHWRAHFRTAGRANPTILVA